jgi:hypothetical protein
MNDIFSALYSAQAGARHGSDLEGRAFMPYLAVVTTNKDPQGRRRVKVSDPIMPALESDWIRRLQPYPGFDPPLPAIGSTVIVFSIDGDPLNGWYLQCVNDTNKPLGKADAINDFYSVVAGDTDERTDGDRTINVGKSLTLKTDCGSSFELTESGSVIITDGSGNSLNFSNGIAFNTSSLSVGGKQLATVGALDNGGDVLTTKGWS